MVRLLAFPVDPSAAAAPAGSPLGLDAATGDRAVPLVAASTSSGASVDCCFILSGVPAKACVGGWDRRSRCE